MNEQINRFLKKLVEVFKRRKSSQKINTLEVDSINALANQLMKEGRSNELELKLEKINPAELNKLEKESWYHLYGICAFQRNDHEQAMMRFSEGLKQLPNCQQIRFSLAQEFIFLNKPEKAFLEFDKCSFPDIPQKFLIRMSNYAYLFNEYQRGMNYISQFFPHYFNLKNLDDHFLYVRGLPFFSTCWLNYAGHCILSNKINKLKELYDKVKNECPDYYAIEEMAIVIEAHYTRNYERMIALTSQRLDKLKNQNFPNGFLKTQIASLMSLKSTHYEDAINLLNAITYTENDHHWLSDIILLAKACAAHRFDRINDEDQYRKAFIKKQPLLFEVEHAISFGLLEYQETLKKLAIPVKLKN